MEKVVVDKLDIFFLQYKRQVFKKGEVLIRADEDPSGIFYLKEGMVKEYAISQKGDELVVNIFKPIAFFPMSWAINNTPNMYYFEAITDVIIYKTSREQVVAFIKQEPDVLFDLLGRVYKGTDGILTRMTYLMAGNAYARLATELLIHARRFGKSEGNSIVITISEKDLAAQTGMSRETISREIKIFKNRGLVTFDKGLLSITSVEKFEEELGLL